MTVKRYEISSLIGKTIENIEYVGREYRITFAGDTFIFVECDAIFDSEGFRFENDLPYTNVTVEEMNAQFERITKRLDEEED